MQNQETVLREKALQRLVTAFISAGLLFLVLPGTFLGVWNLIAISNHRSAHSLSAAWIQAHGQAQIFGWIGTFVIGIGFYSLSKMGAVMPFAVIRGWLSWSLWISGAALRWATGVYGWHWRVLLPLAAALELAGFLLFFFTVRRHKASPAGGERRVPEVWMRLVIASTFAFLLSLLWSFAATLCASFLASAPALPPAADRHLLLISAWGFLVVAVWGFNARWLPVFLGLPQPHVRGLMSALTILLSGVLSGIAGLSTVSSLLLIVASAVAAQALHVFQRSVHPPKVQGIHPSFPYFVRGAYVWLVVAATLSFISSLADKNGGIAGASRHALTVGFLATMVFAIGQRILPAFCGMRVLFSKRIMFAALFLLNLGCLLRVACEIPAYEYNAMLAWKILPASAILELTAVALFATNMVATFLRPPAHLLAVPTSPLVATISTAK
ncbi:MAG: NnrS family protein [Bryobacteraceae bacterium]